VLQFETHIGKLDYLLGVNYLFIPKKYVDALGGLKCGRLVCKVNEKISFQCGIVSLSDGDAYITINKARMKSLKLEVGDSVNISLEKDNSEFGFDLCPELQSLFDQAPEIFERFKRLKPGMQRQIIHHIGSAKSSDVRTNRAVVMLGRVMNIPEGKETFKAIFGKPSD
jgi:hypothetical protein